MKTGNAGPNVNELSDFERSWMTEMVVIPKALAIDLVHYLSGTACIIHEMDDERLEAGEHEAFHIKHQERMEALSEMIDDRLSTMNAVPNALNKLNALCLAYEGTMAVSVS